MDFSSEHDFPNDQLLRPTTMRRTLIIHAVNIICVCICSVFHEEYTERHSSVKRVCFTINEPTRNEFSISDVMEVADEEVFATRQDVVLKQI